MKKAQHTLAKRLERKEWKDHYRPPVIPLPAEKKAICFFRFYVDLFNARKYYAHIIFIESCSNIEYNNLIENI